MFLVPTETKPGIIRLKNKVKVPPASLKIHFLFKYDRIYFPLRIFIQINFSSK